MLRLVLGALRRYQYTKDIYGKSKALNIPVETIIKALGWNIITYSSFWI